MAAWLQAAVNFLLWLVRGIEAILNKQSYSLIFLSCRERAFRKNIKKSRRNKIHVEGALFIFVKYFAEYGLYSFSMYPSA